MNKKNKPEGKRVKKALDKLYRWRGEIMSMREILEKAQPTWKDAHLRRRSRKKVCLEYKELAHSVTEYTAMWENEAGEKVGVRIPKVIFDWLDLPETRSEQAKSKPHLRGSWMSI